MIHHQLGGVKDIETYGSACGKIGGAYLMPPNFANKVFPAMNADGRPVGSGCERRAGGDVYLTGTMLVGGHFAKARALREACYSESHKNGFGGGGTLLLRGIVGTTIHFAMLELLMDPSKHCPTVIIYMLCQLGYHSDWGWVLYTTEHFWPARKCLPHGLDLLAGIIFYPRRKYCTLPSTSRGKPLGGISMNFLVNLSPLVKSFPP